MESSSYQKISFFSNIFEGPCFYYALAFTISECLGLQLVTIDISLIEVTKHQEHFNLFWHFWVECHYKKDLYGGLPITDITTNILIKKVREVTEISLKFLEGDVHSPLLKGFLWSHCGWFLFSNAYVETVWSMNF